MRVDILRGGSYPQSCISMCLIAIKFKGGAAMSPTTQAEVSQKILDSVQSLAIDNAEIKNTLKHIDNKFDRVNDDIRELKESVFKAASDASYAKEKVVLLESKMTDVEKDTDRLFEKFRERDKKSDADRKWIIGTAITVIALAITIITFIINYFA